MLNKLMTLASGAGGKPLIPENDMLIAFKDVVNYLSTPQISLTIFTILFVLMMIFYKQWTKPKIALPIAGICIFFYFGSMLIDVNYLAIIKKPDNVPITIMLLALGLCVWVAYRQAALNDERLSKGLPLIEGDKEDKVLTWPDLVYTEMLCLIIATTALILWAVLSPAPLEAPANPAGPPNPSKAPWYFLGLQEMLVYFDPWMAGVLLPGMIVSGLIMMPYIDINPKGNGYYTIRERKFAIYTWMFSFLILWVILIVYGTFLRGPNWNFFGPYEYWDSHMQVPLTNINLSEYFWNYMLGMPTPSSPLVREVVGIAFTAFWCLALPVILAKTVMKKLYMQMGAIRFYIMAFHFVILAMLPLKMVLRWLFTMKYFVNLPEFNMNL